ncbi:hypothetical protein QMN58_26055, partial [Escherichia coli]|nr:hypothetical protein [Escherichia coli]
FNTGFVGTTHPANYPPSFSIDHPRPRLTNLFTTSLQDRSNASNQCNSHGETVEPSPHSSLKSYCHAPSGVSLATQSF